jgi:hypothetical protein
MNRFIGLAWQHGLAFYDALIVSGSAKSIARFWQYNVTQTGSK